MSKLAKYLNRHLVGNVFDRPSILAEYAHDRSMLEIMPKLIAFPETARDLRRLIGFANQLTLRGYPLSVTMRGSGLDKTGAAIGDNLVISTSHLDQIEEIDLRGRLVRAQPGVTLGSLNTALQLHGLYLPIGTDPRATLGGLIANCPNDDLSSQHGGIFRYIDRVEVILANGELAQFAAYGPRALAAKQALTNFEGAIYRDVDQLLDQHADTVVERSMQPFDAAGYANVTRVRQGHSFNLLPLLFASQGTLAVVSDIILRTEPLPAAEQRLVAILPDAKALLRALDFIIDLEPSSIRLYDMRIVETATTFGKRPSLLENSPATGYLVTVGFNNHKSKANRKIQQAVGVLPLGTFAIEEADVLNSEFAEFESMLLGYLNDDDSGERTAIADDVYVPSYRLTDFLAGLKTLEETLAVELPLYGSFLTSNYNVRPLIDYSSLDGRRLSIDFLRQYGKLVVDCDGSITGGSPEGRVKTLSLAQPLPEAEEKLYLELKQIFDPNNILNPDVKLGADFRKVLRSLRTKETDGIVTP